MLAGISGAMCLMACGLALAGARYAGRADAGIGASTLRNRIRLAAVLLILAGAAAFCGYQLQVLHDTCQRNLLVRHRPGLTVEGEQFDRLFVLHSVLIIAVAIAAFAMVRRCTAGYHPADRLTGLAGLIALANAGAALVSTYPASIYGRGVAPYGMLIYFVGLPAALLLLVTSLFLLGRLKLHSDADADSDYPLCLACGYNLTGNTSGCCPECGSPIPEATKRRLLSPHVQATDQLGWPRGIVLACLVFAVLWLGISLIRYMEVLDRVIHRLLPTQVAWPLTWESYYPFPARFARIGPDLAIAVVLMIGACGLSRHRRWGLWVCYVWVVVVIPLALADAIRAGASCVYGLSPGYHSDVAGLSIGFLRAIIDAGFPVFLGLWMSQRHVRRRMGGWN